MDWKIISKGLWGLRDVTCSLPAPIQQVHFNSYGVPMQFWVPLSQDLSSFPPLVDSPAMQEQHYLLPLVHDDTFYTPVPCSEPNMGAKATTTLDEWLHVSVRDKGKGKACAVLCHHSPGWISLEFRQDPLHLD